MHPLTMYVTIFGPFQNFAQKRRQKIAKHGGANSVAGIPSPYSTCVYSFLGDKNCCSRQTAFWPQKRQGPETPYFLVFPPPKPCRLQPPPAKAGDQIPLFGGAK